jgi:ATP-dependent DNA helicase RecQ
VTAAVLLADIQRVLDSHSAGLNAREVRVELAKMGRRSRPAEIDQALADNPRLFVPLAAGIWRSRAVVEAEEVAAGLQDAKPENPDEQCPTLAAMPPMDAFIAFDLETTGLSPERDAIIQIAGVRIVNGAPAEATSADGAIHSAVFNRYVNLQGRELPYGLRDKLGLIQHPEWEEQLQTAAPIADVLAEFVAWAGDLPLVAHNGRRFDFELMDRAASATGLTVTNPRLDSLELAALAFPALSTLKLEDLGRELGVAAGQPDGRQVEDWAGQCGVADFSWTSFHNAVVDVLVLAAIVQQLIAHLQDRFAARPLLAAALAELFPAAAASLGVTPPADDLAAHDLARLTVGQDEPPAGRLPPLDFDFTPAAVVERFQQTIQSQGLKRRESQVQMIEHVARALQDSHMLAIEAPTGTGKTLAYLIPGALWARSQQETVVIATYTRLLQDQMATDDLEKLRNGLGEDVRDQVLKGMTNYICLDRAQSVFAQTEWAALDSEHRFAWLILLCWLSATRDGTLDELNPWARYAFPALKDLADSLRAERGECSRDQCPHYAACYHRRAYQRAATADLVIMNHALLLSKDWDQAAVPFARVVIDEAHLLEDAATDAATDEITYDSINYLVNRLLNRRSGQGLLVRLRAQVRDADGQRFIAVVLQKRNALAALVLDFGDHLKRFVELNQSKVDPRYGAKFTLQSDPRRANPTSWRPAQEAREHLTTAMRETAQALGHLRDWLTAHPLPTHQSPTLREIDYLSRQLSEQADLLNTLLRVGYDRLARVHWIEVERAIPAERESPSGDDYTGPYRWAVKRAPVRVGPYLAQHLYDRCQTVVFTSATLRTTVESGFGFVLDRLGLSDRLGSGGAIVLPPEFDYGRALFAIARYLPYDGRPSEQANFIGAVGDELIEFFKFTGGYGLGLFTARDRMTKVYHKIEEPLGQHSITLGCQGESGSNQMLLEELRARPGHVLLGLRTYWQGVDVPGSNLSYVVMEKLPFPLFLEPIIRARSAEVKERGRREFADYILPLMLIAFKQGFGRLIRGEEDLGAVLLLDKRVWNRDYRRDLINALPGIDTPGRAPHVLEEPTILSRRAVYQAILDHMCDKSPPDWPIDFQRMQAVLATIPERILTALETMLAELQVPHITPVADIGEIWDKVLRGLRELFKFPDWRVPEQSEVVRTLLAGQDALVVLPTGSGKSVTFQLPALLRDGTTLVFSPLKALMKDQVDKLLDNGLSVVERVDSSQSAEEQERVYQRMRDGTVRLVYIAPERVRDPKLMAAVREARHITQIVVDEAHCVHMWGQSFRPDYLYIPRLVDAITEARGQRPPIAALTATATPRVRQCITARLGLRSPVREIFGNPNRPELRFLVYNSRSPRFRINSPRDKLRLLLRILRAADRRDENAIVYVSTTREAERLAGRLESAGLDARAYHGKMDDQTRQDVQDMFLDGQIRIIVATKAFGMGVDKSDIRYVIHYQVPGDLESYFQEAGRAGRDGQTSYCVLIYHPDDLWIHENYFIPHALPEPHQLANVLGWVRSHMSGDVLYADPRQMADDLGFDEDRELGILLHFLEQLGFVRRDVDVTLKASTRLLIPLPAVVAQAAQITGNQATADSIGQFLLSRGVNQLSRAELDVVAGAHSVGLAPMGLDDLLHRLALSGCLIYRAFARAYTLTPGPRLNSNAPIDLNTSEIGQVRTELQANLKAMQRYAESLDTGDCLRAEILSYLGDKKPPTRAADCCSLCDVNMPTPWDSEPLFEDLTDPARYHDAKYATLQAIAWNAGLANQRYRAPYGQSTLAYILLGNDYMATRYVDDAARRKARIEHIIASSHFGVLEGLSGGIKAINTLIGELRVEGYITDQTYCLPDRKYTYPAPTDLGHARLAEGLLFTDAVQS